MIANGMADTFGWPRKRLAAARKRLIGAHMEQVRPASSLKGPALLPLEIQGWSKMTTYPQLTPLPLSFFPLRLCGPQIRGN
jgi:hypothetical protein